MAVDYFERMRELGPHHGVWQVMPQRTHQKALAEIEGHETWDEPGEANPKGHSIQYHGGEVLSSARFVAIWGGQKDVDKDRFDSFAKDLMTAGYFEAAKPYLRGAFSGTYWGAVDGPTITKSPFTQEDASAYVRDLIARGVVPQPDRHTIYSIMLPEGIVAQLSSDSSCGGPSVAFCAYHFGDGDMLIDVEPDPTCGGCGIGQYDHFDLMTALLSHEVCESVEDPFGQGWYEDKTGMEPSDIVAWIILQWGPWKVQGYFGNEGGGTNLLGPYNAPAPQKSLTISGPTQIIAGEPGSYGAQVAPPDGAAQYSWTVNGAPAGQGQHVSLTFPQAGNAVVGCRAFSGGQIPTATLAVSVTAAPSGGNFIAKMDAEFDREVELINAQDPYPSHPDWWLAMAAGIQWSKALQDQVARGAPAIGPGTPATQAPPSPPGPEPS